MISLEATPENQRTRAGRSFQTFRWWMTPTNPSCPDLDPGIHASATADRVRDEDVDGRDKAPAMTMMCL